jgi:NAD-dependent deacetylase
MPPTIDLDTITHVFLTGAGISAESGLPTFRGTDGLWRNHRPEVLADIRTWRTNYELVHAFYSMRRARLAEVEPNAAHLAIAALGERALVITQNVDNLFERAGCPNIIHLHGRLWRMQCLACDHDWDIGATPWGEDDTCPNCATRAKVKPGVVMFHELAPAYAHLDILTRLDARHTLAVIGTSGHVLDINTLMRRSPAGRKILNNAEASPAISERLFNAVFYAPATEVIEKVIGG